MADSVALADVPAAVAVVEPDCEVGSIVTEHVLTSLTAAFPCASLIGVNTIMHFSVMRPAGLSR